MSDWAAGLYLRFEDERTRPAAELLARVPSASPGKAVDIGCGPGNSTELIAGRWPAAAVSGFDSSPAMLEAARKRLPGVRFFQADVVTWTPDGDEGLLYANAVFQWVPDHLAVLERLFAALRPGAVLAVQMPDNFDEPSHVGMREAAEAGPWRERLTGAERARDRLLRPSVYYDRLQPLADHVDLWATTYQHRLADIPAIIEWVKATGLRPYLAPLNPGETEGFLAAYHARLAKAYPLQADGSVLLPFPRFFLVARRR